MKGNHHMAQTVRFSDVALMMTLAVALPSEAGLIADLIERRRQNQKFKMQERPVAVNDIGARDPPDASESRSGIKQDNLSDGSRGGATNARAARPQAPGG